MERTFTISLFYKIFYGSIAAVMVGGSIFLLFDVPLGGSWLLIGLLFCTGILIALAAFKRKITISDTGVVITNLLGTKHFYTNEIRGIRIGDKTLSIVPIDDMRKAGVIAYTDLGDSSELTIWLKDNFRDLDQEEFEHAKAELLEDTGLGFTMEEREAKFNKIRQIGAIYTIAGIALVVVTVFLHQQVKALQVLLFVYPLCGILILAFSNGLARLYASKNDVYVNVFIGIFFSAGGLILQVVTTGHILDFDEVWISVGPVAAVLIMILTIIVLKQPNPTFAKQSTFILLAAGAYAFGAVLETNTALDDSVPKVYTANVLDHYVKHGKSSTYHLCISKWGPLKEESDITVTAFIYNQVDVGSAIRVNLKEGKLHIPWFDVEVPAEPSFPRSETGNPPDIK